MQHPIQREGLDALKGLAVIEFGAAWCEYCRGAQPIITAALAQHPNITHIKIEDGKGQRLGRSYVVKLWPTLIFLKDGIEVARLVRPTDMSMIADTLRELAGALPDLPETA